MRASATLTASAQVQPAPATHPRHARTPNGLRRAVDVPGRGFPKVGFQLIAHGALVPPPVGVPGLAGTTLTGASLRLRCSIDRVQRPVALHADGAAVRATREQSHENGDNG